MEAKPYTDPEPGNAFQEYRIIKEDDPNFVKTEGTFTQEHVQPKYSMPSGPGVQKGSKRRKTRTFPKSILKKSSKIYPSRNPTKSPPTRKAFVNILSDNNVKKLRRTAKNRALKTDIPTIRNILIANKIISADKKDIPPNILRTLYADSVSAGLLN
jgi:hypothetical protein